MKDPISRTSRLQLLSDSPKKEDEMEKSKIRWINQSSGGRVHLGEEVVELVIPASASISEAFRFARQLDEKLQQNDSYGRLVIVQPQSRGTVFGIRIQSLVLNKLLDKLSNIPEVEKIEGHTNERSALYDYPKSFEVLLRKGRSPLMVLQNLKETDMDRQELAAELG